MRRRKNEEEKHQKFYSFACFNNDSYCLLCKVGGGHAGREQSWEVVGEDAVVWRKGFALCNLGRGLHFKLAMSHCLPPSFRQTPKG